MSAKNILGLDLGANSIGWALVRRDEENEQENKILLCGSRILPTDAKMLDKFETGATTSQTHDRTQKRGVRRLYERHKLRRSRLCKVLNLLGWLPKHYAEHLDEHGNMTSEVKFDTTDDKQYIFGEAFEEMCNDFGGRTVSHDWTIYYLRRKALRERLTPTELAFVLLNFNTKRGYNQTRSTSEDESKEEATKEIVSVKVVSTKATGKSGDKTNYTITLENGGEVSYKSAKPIEDWVGQTKEFICETQFDADGNIKIGKDGKEIVRYKYPEDDDWTAKKLKTENEIETKGETVGEHIYNLLKKGGDEVKIIGEKVQTIDRRFYREELRKILTKQEEFVGELTDEGVYERCVEALYPNNETRRRVLLQRRNEGLKEILMDDIIFYQRPLKSKKSLIADCPIIKGKKVMSKSNPIFQEYRLWGFVNNIDYESKDEKGKLTREVRSKLFERLTRKKKVKKEEVENMLWEITEGRKKKKSDNLKKVNLVEGKEYPCYETRTQIANALIKGGMAKESAWEWIETNVECEMKIWHILYSVMDTEECRKAFTKMVANDETLREADNKMKKGESESAIADALARSAAFKSDYASYSEAAVKRLLPLMRSGETWKWENMDEKTRDRCEKIMTGEVDDTIDERTREKLSGMKTEEDFAGLQQWLASYAAFGKHSEAKNAEMWTSPQDINKYINKFKQHSLRNPIVEMVIMETMRVVRDLWQKMREKDMGEIDEIHLEMAREMNKTAAERKMISEQNVMRENENEAIRKLLREFANDAEMKEVRPNSPIQQMKLKLVVEGAFEHAYINTNKDDKEAIDEIKEMQSKLYKGDIGSSDIKKYRLWLEQHYCSPYTGRNIELSRLFTTDYEIEHVIPRSVYYDDSMLNKVICESAVNKKKDKMLGMEFIKKMGGIEVELGNGEKVKILTEEGYRALVNTTFADHRKRERMLAEEIPQQFTNQQMQNTRYIAREIMGALGNIVRTEDNGQAESNERPKNLIVCTGKVTDRLKNDWGVNEAWSRIIIGRFERLNKKQGTSDFTRIKDGHKIPDVPESMKNGFSKKRIDHRHHTMDAIVIACATQEIVRLLNNESAQSTDYTHLRERLTHKSGTVNMPWTNFTREVEDALRDVVVSFKHSERVLTRRKNKYARGFDEKGKRKTDEQETISVKRALHAETVWGRVNLRRTEDMDISKAVERVDNIVDREVRKKVRELLGEGKDGKAIKKYFAENEDVWRGDVVGGKVRVYYFTEDEDKKAKEGMCATRAMSELTGYFDLKKTKEDALKKIGAISDSGIQKILTRHLERCDGDPAKAFSVEGLEMMNRDICELNGGKQHKPIKKVRRCEVSTAKFAVGLKGNKSTKFVEADKGSNLFFAVYESAKIDKKTGEERKERVFETIGLRTAMANLKDKRPIVPETDKDGHRLLFYISPGDLVYVPIGNETEVVDKTRIYKFVSCANRRAFFVPYSVAKPIYDK